MRCIGDECQPGGAPQGGAGPVAPVRLMRSVAVGALCAGLGYHAARSHGPEITAASHLAALAPPLVVSSRLDD